MKLTFTLCLILFCVGLSVVTEAKRTTKSRSYSSTKTFYSTSKGCENSNNNDDGKTYCEVLDLPQVCTLEYVPVCAHIRDCEGDSCFETAGNVCAACTDGKYDYFTQGECPAGESENEEESGPVEEQDDKLYCELLDITPVCTQIYDPVCAHLRDCEGDSCYETVGNGCLACGSEGKYDYFTQGECPAEESNEVRCELVDVPEVCTQIYDPVCAHIRDCEGDSCHETVGNGCTACSSEGKYDSFVPGECPSDKLYCDLLDVSEVCTLEYDPVCAHIRDCEGDSCFETVGNGCTACSSEGKFDYFTQGECPAEESNEVRCELVDVPEVCTLEYDPVCAHIRDCEGDSCFETVGNGCTACSSEGKFDYFTQGECPAGGSENEEEGRPDETNCDLVDVPEVCPQIYEPVCAHRRGCEGDYCSVTIGNGCVACSSEGAYDSFVPGECEPQAERKYCDDDNRPDFCTKEYFPVCAHHNDDSFSTAGNKCMACSKSDIDYYTLGAC